MRAMILCARMSGHCAPSSRVGEGGLPEPVSSAPRVWLAGHQEKRNSPYGKVIRGLPFRNGQLSNTRETKTGRSSGSQVHHVSLDLGKL